MRHSCHHHRCHSSSKSGVFLTTETSSALRESTLAPYSLDFEVDRCHPSQRGTCGHQDRDSRTPTHEDEQGGAQRSWKEILDAPNTMRSSAGSTTQHQSPGTEQASSSPHFFSPSVREDKRYHPPSLCIQMNDQDCPKVQNEYVLPQVASSQTPRLDSYLRTEIPPATKAVDKELSTIQTHVLNTLTSLSAILKGQDTPDDTSEQGTTPTSRGRFKLRRSITLPEFARKFKQLVDQMKAMRLTLSTLKPFFRLAPQQLERYTQIVKKRRSLGGRRKSFQKNSWK